MATAQKGEFLGEARAPDTTLTGEPAQSVSFAPVTQGLESGSRIGPYEIHERVGDGGMAAVFKAWHTGLARFEALKIPRHQATHGPEADFVRRLLTEARTAAGLQHPNIVAIHTVSDPAAPVQYFSMEFVEGLDLDRLIQQRGRLSLEEAVPILRQIASALDFAHSRGVVHRDIKPANILLMPLEGAGQWHARVVDFGISRAAEDADHTRLTKSGMMVGTPEYMSPEQAGSGDPVTTRTDLYSLAVLAYEMLSGAPPFTAADGVSRMAILMKHVRETPAPLPGQPRHLNESLLRALAKDPQQRFATCTEFVTHLEAAITRPAVPGGMLLPRSGLAARTGALPMEAGTLSARVEAGHTTVTTPHRTRTTALDNTVPAVDADIVRRWRAVEHRPARRSFMVAGVGGLFLALLLVMLVRRADEEPTVATPALTPPLTKAATAATAPHVSTVAKAPVAVPGKATRLTPVAAKQAPPRKPRTITRVVAKPAHRVSRVAAARPAPRIRKAAQPRKTKAVEALAWQIAAGVIKRRHTEKSELRIHRRRVITEERGTTRPGRRGNDDLVDQFRREAANSVRWRELRDNRPPRMEPLPGVRRDSSVYLGSHW